MRKTLKRSERLTREKDIKQTFESGVAIKGKRVILYIKKNNLGGTTRACFIVKRRLYNKKSVLRNRFRRILREAYRNIKFRFHPGLDIIVFGYKLDRHIKSTDIEEDMRYALEKGSKKYNSFLS